MKVSTLCIVYLNKGNQWNSQLSLPPPIKTPIYRPLPLPLPPMHKHCFHFHFSWDDIYATKNEEIILQIGGGGGEQDVLRIMGNVNKAG